MTRGRSSFQRWLARRVAPTKGIEIVLDRRRGDRRNRAEPVNEERRREDRRRPPSNDLGEVTCFLGEGTRFKGDLSFRGAFRVDGRLEGESVRGEVLIIGEQGHVDAEVQVQILRASGRMQGNVTATRWAELLQPSHVTGTIRTPRLTIWRGAIFNGKCEMPPPQCRDAEADQPAEDAASTPSSSA
jgi:cytoskeletal protein CcmA (bactofilin family)